MIKSTLKNLSVGNPYYFPLNQYGGAVAAYSLRLLNYNYSGNAIRVRRSSDNSEQDIGFNGIGLDNETLLTFAGSGSAFVTTWYDQSGGSKNVTQNTASSQPRIVNSGSLVTLGGKVAIDFDGVNDRLKSSAFDINQALTQVLVAKLDATGSAPYSFISGLTSANRCQSYISTGVGTPFSIFAGNILNSSFVNTNQNIIFSVFNGANSSLHINEVERINGDSGANKMDGITIGDDSLGGAYFDGKMQEAVVYGSDKLSQISDLSNNINDYFKIY